MLFLILFLVVIFSEQDNFYSTALHEIDHAIGLGHVVTTNIMNVNGNKSLDSLQTGNIAGIRSIYGH